MPDTSSVLESLGTEPKSQMSVEPDCCPSEGGLHEVLGLLTGE